MATIRPENGVKWEIEAVAMDDALSGINDIRLVKMDIEGAELLALQGFRDSLATSKAPFILCEVTDSFLKELGGSSEMLYALMWLHGYSAFRLIGERLEAVPQGRVPSGFQDNVLFSTLGAPRI